MDLHTARLLIQAASVPLFATVAYVVRRRQVSADARGARNGFVLWWAGLAFLGLFVLAFDPRIGIDLYGYGIGFVLVVIYVILGGYFAMIAGLVYYLLYLYTGKRATKWWVVGFYVALFAYLVYYFQSLDPTIGVRPDGQSFLDMGDRPSGLDARSLLLTAGFVLPPIGAAIAYLALFFKVKDRTGKYRILLVSVAILLVFLFSLGSSLTSLDNSTEPPATVDEQRALERSQDLRGIFSGLLSAVAAGLVFLAFRPPTWVQAKYGIRSTEDRIEAAAG
jgi:hypothetical protein